MAKDPICGMFVEESDNSIHHNKNGIVYYFCSTQCLNEFLEPEKHGAEQKGASSARRVSVWPRAQKGAKRRTPRLDAVSRSKNHHATGEIIHSPRRRLRLASKSLLSAAHPTFAGSAASPLPNEKIPPRFPHRCRWRVARRTRRDL